MSDGEADRSRDGLACPVPQDVPGPTAPEGIATRLLGPPLNLGRREVSRGAGVSLRSARKFWHALGFPLVTTDDPLFTQADLGALRQGPVIASVLRRAGTTTRRARTGEH